MTLNRVLRLGPDRFEIKTLDAAVRKIYHVGGEEAALIRIGSNRQAVRRFGKRSLFTAEP